MRPGLKALLMLAPAGLASFVLWRIHPAETPWMPVCPLLQHTGLYCSGCGSLRALHFLLHGDFPAAWAMNPLTVLMLPIIAWLAIAELFFNNYRPANRIRPVWVWLLLVVFIFFAALRNIPHAPFNLLAPH